jgi:hypothetical protein
MFTWYSKILVHTDLYGSGSKGFIDLNLLYNNFLSTFKEEPVLLFIILISILVIVLQIIRKKIDIHFKILSGLVLVQLADLLMVLKHFSLHYFIPVIPTLAVNLFIILQMFRVSKIFKILVIAPIIAVCLLLNLNFTKYVPFEYLSEDKIDGINVYSYKGKSLMAAIRFGEDRSRNANSDKLKKIYGDEYFYDLSYKTFSTWTETIALDSLFRINSKVYLHALDGYMKEWPPPFDIKFISEGLYLIENQKSDSLTVK